MKSIKSTNQEHTNVINVALAWNFSMKLSLSKQSYIHLWPNSINPLQCYVTVCQCWNWPKRTGGVSCRNVWNFAQGLKFKADFHSKMGVCRHELRGGVQPANPPTIPTLLSAVSHLEWSERCVTGDASVTIITDTAWEDTAAMTMTEVWTSSTNVDVINCPPQCGHSSTGVSLVIQRCPPKTSRTTSHM